MLSSILMLVALTSEMDPLSSAVSNYRNVNTYKVTLRSRSAESSEVIKYYYKKPGFVRMEFVTPHEGTVIVYDPLTKEAKLRPFPTMKSLVLTMSPESSLIRSPTGHRIDKSDVGELLKKAMSLQKNGQVEILSAELLGGRQTHLISVEGTGDFSVDGIHRYHLWLDSKTSLPLKASSYDIKGSLIEEVVMEDLEINLDLEEGLFDL